MGGDVGKLIVAIVFIKGVGTDVGNKEVEITVAVVVDPAGIAAFVGVFDCTDDFIKCARSVILNRALFCSLTM